jgi:hypothetical protein
MIAMAFDRGNDIDRRGGGALRRWRRGLGRKANCRQQ